MRFAAHLLLGTVLALVLMAHPIGTGAQDKSSRPYTVIVGHVVTLHWTASTTLDVTSYNVYVSGTSGGPYTKIGATAQLQFSDLNATKGNTYFYVVTAVDGSGESVYSTQVSATIPTP